jgi:ribonuclease HII
VCGVLTPCDWSLKGLADSKELSRKQHQELYQHAVEQSLEFKVAVVPLASINEEGISAPLKRAKLEIVEHLRKIQPKARVVLDGEFDFPEDWKDCWCAPKADSYVPSVMMAANIAKHLRDTYMMEQSRVYPAYGFDNHAGYGTPKHIEALNAHGPCALHRTSYKPIQKYVEEANRKPVGVQDVSEDMYALWRAQRGTSKT